MLICIKMRIFALNGYCALAHTQKYKVMLIDLRHIDIRHDADTILSDVDLHVSEGEFVYIIGKVGTGKSSLMRALYAGIPVYATEMKDEPADDCELRLEDDEASDEDAEAAAEDGKEAEADNTNGEDDSAGDDEKREPMADVLGFDLFHLKRKHYPTLRRQLGIVFQDFKLLRDRTVYANLDFVLRATGWKRRDERQARIDEVMERVGLADKLDKFPHELSGGEQQRVAIARALLNKPAVILADEPTGNLDQETSRHIVGLLHSIRERGTAVIMITHQQFLLDEFPGSAVYECKDGRLRIHKH